MNNNGQGHTYKHFFNGSTPIQRRSVVCYLDYLGYQDLIAKDATGGLLHRLHSVYSKVISEIKASRTASELFSVRTFSDNVLIACPIDVEADAENEFAIVLNLVSMFQREMALHGYFFRGAMEIGDLHVNEDMIFGKAIVDAYVLESKHAKFPRIVIGPELKKQLQAWGKNYAPNENPSTKALYQYDDGYWFVNYLFNLYLMDEPARPEEIQNHKIQIESVLRNEKRPDVREKYLWLARYHDAFCSQHGLSSFIANGKITYFNEIKF